MVRITGAAPFCIEPRRHSAGAQGFEPCAAVLEAACSPRSTLLSRVAGGNRTRHLPVHSRPCRNHYTTATIDSGVRNQGSGLKKTGIAFLTPDPWFLTPVLSDPGWTRTTALSHVKGTSWPLNDGTNQYPEQESNPQHLVRSEA